MKLHQYVERERETDRQTDRWLSYISLVCFKFSALRGVTKSFLKYNLGFHVTSGPQPE